MGVNIQNPPGELDNVTVEENIEKVKKNDEVAQNLTWAALVLKRLNDWNDLGPLL
jgi:hypothetical protein